MKKLQGHRLALAPTTSPLEACAEHANLQVDLDTAPASKYEQSGHSRYLVVPTSDQGERADGDEAAEVPTVGMRLRLSVLAVVVKARE